MRPARPAFFQRSISSLNLREVSPQAVESFSSLASAMMASLASLAWERSLSRACAHLRRDWLNVVRAAEKRFHSARPRACRCGWWCAGDSAIHRTGCGTCPRWNASWCCRPGRRPVLRPSPRWRCVPRRLGHGGLAGLGQFGLLGLAGGLQRLELFLERGDIAHDCGLGGLLAQQLQGLVDLTGFDIGRGQAAGQQIKLGLEIQETTGVQRQGLFLGASGNWPTSRSVSPSLTKTVPLSSTRPKASAALTSASEYAACAAGAQRGPWPRGPS